ncbi:MAG: TolB family protein [Acidimicrobiia bacterium]
MVFGAIGAVVLGVFAAPSAFGAPGTATGTCTATTVGPQSDGEALVTFAAPPSGTVVGAELTLTWSGIDNADLVAALYDPAERGVGLLAGAAGEGGTVTFSDDAPTPGAGLAPVEGRLAGEAAPLEPLSGLSGTPAAGSWSLIVLNLADDGDLRIETCTLRLDLEVEADPGPGSSTTSSTAAPLAGGAVTPRPRAAASGATSGSTALPTTGADLAAVAGVGAALVAAGVVLRGGRRRVAAGLSLAVVAATLAATTAPEPAAAAGTPTHPWGTPPDGRAFLSGGKQIGNDDQFDGIVSQVPGCPPMFTSCWHTLTQDPFVAETFSGEGTVAVSPTGQQVAFTRYVVDTTEFGPAGGSYIHVLDLRTGVVRRITSPADFADDEYGYVYELAWSPDEQKILFSTNWDLWTVDVGFFADGAHRRPTRIPGDALAACPEREISGEWLRHPTWSPDGSTIAFAVSNTYWAQCDGVYLASTASLDGARKLTDQQAFSLDWSPDGQTLAATIFAETVLLDAQTGEVVRTLAPGIHPARWAPAGDRLLLGRGLVAPDGTPLTTRGQCYGPSSDPEYDDELALCATGDVRETGDLQCSPGSCLSGIVLRGTSEANYFGLITASGGVSGVFNIDTVAGGYLFAKRPAGTYSIGLSAEGAFPTTISCDDADSTATVDPATRTASITARIADSEIVTCTVEVALVDDLDGDGIPDDIDPCPADALNMCVFDQDGDGILDEDDPCPLDPTNSCDDGDGDDEDDEGYERRCSPFRVGIVGATGGLDWFRFDVFGRACNGPDEGLRSELFDVDPLGSVALPPLTAALISPIFEVQYDEDANASGIDWHNVDQIAEVTGSFDLCALPSPPGLGSLIGKKLPRLFSLVSRWGGDRLIGKAANLWMKGYTLLIQKTVSGPGTAGVIAAIETVRDALGAAVEHAIVTGFESVAKICVPMWEPTITVTAKSDGSGVFYEVHDQGAPVPRVADLTNAEPL